MSGERHLPKPKAKATAGDRIIAAVLLGLVVAWLVAYAIVAVRAWLGRG